MANPSIIIASDHAGYALKEDICQWLTESKIPFTDHGTNSNKPVDYPEQAKLVAQSISSHYSQPDSQSKSNTASSTPFGILVCGSGVGMSITANKFNAVLASLCYSTEIAKLSRQHNNANIACLGARFLTTAQAIEIIQEFISTPFEEGRHLRRITAIPTIVNK